LTTDEAIAALGLEKPTTIEEAHGAFKELTHLLAAEGDDKQLQDRAIRHQAWFRSALEALEAEQGDDSAERLNARGLACLKAGYLDGAVQAFSDAIGRGGAHGCNYNRGLTYLQMGDMDRATQDVKQASTLAPKELEIRTTLVKIYLRTQQYGLVRREGELLLKQKPDDTELLYDLALAWTLGDARHPSKAAEKLKQAVRIDREIRQRAEDDTAFDGIRDHPAFVGWQGR
tara:strand:- start:1645 stop:2334 length:690 start_codon:yes stop_codon:yes gene_type:complete